MATTTRDKFALELEAAIGGEIAGTGGGCRALFYPVGAENEGNDVYLMITNADADVPDDEDVMIGVYRRDEDGYFYDDDDLRVDYEGASVDTVANKVREMALALGIDA